MDVTYYMITDSGRHKIAAQDDAEALKKAKAERYLKVRRVEKLTKTIVGVFE